MKKTSIINTSQDYDRKHGRDHVSNNPRAAKDLLNHDDQDKAFENKEFTEDKRKIDERDLARRVHTNHFTNREGNGEKK